jgi:hypothetical protein
VAYFLLCIECKELTNEPARGWRAYLTDEGYGPAEVVVLCPDCSNREFGPFGRRARTDDTDAA